jgi:hypothetical protein
VPRHARAGQPPFVGVRHLPGHESSIRWNDTLPPATTPAILRGSRAVLMCDAHYGRPVTVVTTNQHTRSTVVNASGSSAIRSQRAPG